MSNWEKNNLAFYSAFLVQTISGQPNSPSLMRESSSFHKKQNENCRRSVEIHVENHHFTASIEVIGPDNDHR